MIGEEQGKSGVKWLDHCTSPLNRLWFISCLQVEWSSYRLLTRCLWWECVCVSACLSVPRECTLFSCFFRRGGLVTNWCTVAPAISSQQLGYVLSCMMTMYIYCDVLKYILCYIGIYYDVLKINILWCTEIYCAILEYTMMYWKLIYCDVLKYTVLYWNILWCTEN